MSDTVDFSTVFDTSVQPAGDAATVADALQTVGDTSSADAVSGAADAAAPSANQIGGLGPDTLPEGSASNAAVDPGTGDVVPAATTSTPDATAAAATGTASKGVIDQAAQWAKDNPGMAQIAGKALAGGASGAMTALALRNKLEAEKEREERAREDVIRRGQIQALPAGTFTAKPGGIINTAAGK